MVLRENRQGEGKLDSYASRVSQARELSVRVHLVRFIGDVVSR